MRFALATSLAVVSVALASTTPAHAELIDVRLRAVPTPGTGADSGVALPASYGDVPSSLGDVPVGGTFNLEIWFKDVGAPLWGITTGYLDIAYDTSKVDATGLNHGGLYTNLPSGSISDANGLINEFGGAWLPASAGDPAPGQSDWARLGWISFTRTAAGSVTFTPQQAEDEFSRSTGGAAAWGQIDAPPLTVPEPATMAMLTLGGLALIRRRLSGGAQNQPLMGASKPASS